jgi:glycosyltransferase involved in cell wall biosynthesis
VVAFNLSDIGIPSPLKQVLLFDWPYAAYPKSPAWQRLDGYGFISRKLKLFLFQRYLKYCNVIACQSEVMRDLVKANYPEAKSVVIIPNAVSVDNLVVESSRIWDFNSQKINLLCLTYYYPHKNVEIFIELAEIIVRNCAPFVIVCTISEDQHPKAKKFIEEVKAKGLESVIRLVGAVSMPDVPSLYKACHALLLPTLLESFSGTYVEAFFHRIPVFTSDLEFAKGVCGNGAFYFDPLDAASIYNCLDQAFANPELILQRVDQGAQLLSMMPDWVSVTEKFEQVLDAMV